MGDRPLRVLLVVGETTGGIGRHLGLLAEQLGHHGVAAAVCGPASALAQIGATPGVGQQELAVGRMRPDAVMAARRRMRSLGRGFDVVHAHGLQAGAVAVARPSRIPLVVTWHNASLTGGPRGRAHDLVSRYVARSADLILGASPDLAEAARHAGARSARSTFVVAPPLSPAVRTPEEVRRELRTGSRPIVLAVGRLQGQKRFDVLVDAAARWAGRAEAPVVVIAGDGPDRAALVARARAANAPVVLLGARSDIADLLGAADAVALPSAWEARSLVAQEALRAGVPLVTTPVGGLPELVGDAALQVPVGDGAALTAALERVIADQVLRADLIAKGLRRSAVWPTVSEATAELAATYRSLRT